MGGFVALAIACVHVHGAWAFRCSAAGTRPPCGPPQRRAIAGALRMTAAASEEQEGRALDQSKVHHAS